MTKKLPVLYVLEPVDRCAKNVGLQCGFPAHMHPMGVGWNYHEFQGGRAEFRCLTRKEIKRLLKKVKT